MPVTTSRSPSRSSCSLPESHSSPVGAGRQGQARIRGNAPGRCGGRSPARGDGDRRVLSWRLPRAWAGLEAGPAGRGARARDAPLPHARSAGVRHSEHRGFRRADGLGLRRPRQARRSCRGRRRLLRPASPAGHPRPSVTTSLDGRRDDARRAGARSPAPRRDNDYPASPARVHTLVGEARHRGAPRQSRTCHNAGREAFELMEDTESSTSVTRGMRTDLAMLQLTLDDRVGGPRVLHSPVHRSVRHRRRSSTTMGATGSGGGARRARPSR